MSEEIRCKFIAGDGAYQYLWKKRPLHLEYYLIVSKPIKVFTNISDWEQIENVEKRKYERCETVGRTVVYRES